MPFANYHGEDEAHAVEALQPRRRSAVRDWLPRLLMAGGALGVWALVLYSSGAGSSSRATDLAAVPASHGTAAGTSASPTAAFKSGYKDHAYGTGNSATMKHTWPATDPVAVSAFLLEYFPTTPWLVGNESWVDHNCATWGKVLCGNMTDATFQLHAVSSTIRSDGGVPVSSVEARFSEAVASALDAKEFTPLLDANVGFYTEDLDFYVDRFNCGGIKFVAVEWPSADHYPTKYFSLLVPVPDSLVVIELMGTTLDEAALPGQSALKSDAPRLARTLPPSSHVPGRKYSGRPALSAVKLSYVTSSVDSANRFYTGVLQTTLEKQWSGSTFGFAGESKVNMFTFPQDSAKKLVEVHYWEHDAANDAAQLPVGTLEAELASAHAASHVSDTEGFDQWNDWHYGHRLGNTGTTLDSFVAAAKEHDATYTIFTDYSSDTDSWAYYMYVAAPAGTSVQLVGNFSEPANVPSNVRVFDTCYASGGFEFDSKADVAAMDADKTYINHPDFQTLGLKLQNSDTVKLLDACQRAR